MTLKYESEIIKEIVDVRGHESSLTHYESECIESRIDEVKDGYPKLVDYQSEWLNYIVENPIFSVEIPVEAITQNLSSFIGELEHE